MRVQPFRSSRWRAWIVGLSIVGASLGVVTFAAPPAAGTTYFSEDFEGGLFPMWYVNPLPMGGVGWHGAFTSDVCYGAVGHPAAPFAGSVSAAYHGDTVPGLCTYDNGVANWGELRTNFSIALPAAPPIRLRFFSWHDTELSLAYDQLKVHASADGGSTWTEVVDVKAEAWPIRTWNDVQADIGAFAGQPIYLRFRFDTVDDGGNNLPGWYIDDVMIDDLPFTSGDVLTVAPTVVAPLTAEQGQPNVALLALDLSTATRSVTVDGITVRLSGLPPDPLDVANVEIRQDNGDGTFDSLTDVVLGTNVFGPGPPWEAPISVFLTVSAGTPVRLFVVYDIAFGATAGNWVGAQLRDTSSVSVTGIDTVGTANFPIDSFDGTRTQIVAASPDVLTVAPVVLAPATAVRGTARVPMLRLDLSTPTGSVVAAGVFLNLSGLPPDPADVALVEAWLDDGDSLFEPLADTFLSSGVFFGPGLPLPFGELPVTSAQPRTIFVSYDIAIGATPDNWVGARIAMAFDVQVFPPDSVDSAPFPIDTYLAGVRTRITMPGNPPVLGPTGEPNYVADGLDPEVGDLSTTFVYRVSYSDTDNNPPDAGFPVVYIDDGGVPIPGSPFTLTEVDPLDVTYTDGKWYAFATTQPRGVGYTYYFWTRDATGNGASYWPWPPADAPDVLNRAPIANAGPDQPGWFRGVTVILNGGASSDPDGDVIAFAWTQTAGPAVTLTDASTAQPSFTPTLPGTYTFELTVDDGFGGTAVDTVSVIVVNQAPALSNPLVTPAAGNPGDTFSWTVTYTDADDDPPAAGYPLVSVLKGGVDISGSPFAMAEVNPADTVYTDGKDYAYSTALVPCGADYTFLFETLDTFSGSALLGPSTGPDVACLGIPPTLGPTGETNYTVDGLDPEVGDLSRLYVYRVSYSDADNDAPQGGAPFVHILLGGIDIVGSPFVMTQVDPLDTDYTDGKWYSFATNLLYRATDYTYYFTASDVGGNPAGDWPFPSADAPDVLNRAPIANAGPDQSGVFRGTVVNLDGMGSSDLDGDTLSYSWMQTAGPAVTLTGASIATPTFTATIAAVYTFELTVDDGWLGTDTDTVDVIVVNRPPTLTFSAAPYDNGIDPDTAAAGSYFSFRAVYTDLDNDPPSFVQLHINQSGIPIAGSPFVMGAINPFDTDYTDGKDYNVSLGLTIVATDYLFIFVASDGTDGATSVTVDAPDVTLAQDFDLSCDPATVSSVPGGTTGTTCTISSINGFNAPVNLSCISGPAGCAFSPDTVTPPSNGAATSALTLYVLTTLPAGTYNLYVNAWGGSQGHWFTLQVAIMDFSVSCVPAAVAAQQGGSGTSACTITSLNGFSAPVDLACSGLPTGVGCLFAANPATPPPNGQAPSTLTVTASTVTAGSYAFNLIALSGTLTRTLNLQVTVTALPPDFTIGCTPGSVTVVQGGAGTITTCSLTSQNGFSGAVDLSCGSVPSGVTCGLNPAQVSVPTGGSASSTMTIAASSTAVAGAATIQVTGTSGSLTHVASVELTVNAAPTGSIAGVVRCGDRTAGGATVELLDENGNVVQTTTSAVDGSYRFSNVSIGTYRVRMTAGGCDPTTVDASVTADDPNANAGTVQLTSSVSGTPWWLVLIPIAVAFALLVLFLLLRKKKPAEALPAAPAEVTTPPMLGAPEQPTQGPTSGPPPETPPTQPPSSP